MTAVIRCGETSRTRTEVDARAARIAGGLHAMGLRAGDRVGLVLRNCVEYVEVSRRPGRWAPRPCR